MHLSAESPQDRPHAPQLSSLFAVLTHAPAQQVSPSQLFPHRPQLRLSVCVVLQLSSQHELPGPHDAPAPHWQTPAVQVSPTAQVGSQGTSVVQPPSRQTSAPLQTMPHSPQLFLSSWVSMHDTPQHDWPVAHPGPPPHMHTATGLASASHTSSLVHAGSQGGVTQSPASQTCPSPHTMPHVPQLSADSIKFEQPSSQHALPSMQPDAPRHRH
jgi:hypothetical protein